ncbi:MAG: glycoside hydrolase family 3 protein [Pyrinomonadaceae bacterium]|nr:glycoside hydrolase family 3 protein [Pyrinomonadaceae bacterium]
MVEIEEKYKNLSLKEKVGQMYFIGLPGDSYDDGARRLIEEIAPGGVCLFARNIKKADRTRELLDTLRSEIPFEPFLSLDQEGGLVDRLRRIVTPMPSVQEISADGNVENAKMLAEITAHVVRILGFNMNFAPVIDVTDEARQNFVMNTQCRTFGCTLEDVVEFTTAYLDTLQNAGCLGCLKHFPGIGAVEFDPHNELPTVNLDRDQLFSFDLKPYVEHFARGNVHAIMTGHTTFPPFDLQERDSSGKLLPSSLSKNIVTGLLRDELHFRGLALTDDLEMGAVVENYGIGEASKMAVDAGNDFVLVCNDPEAIIESFNAVYKAVVNGEISEERIDHSLERIFKVRDLLSPPPEFEEQKISSLSDQIDDLKRSL